MTRLYCLFSINHIFNVLGSFVIVVLELLQILVRSHHQELVLRRQTPKHQNRSLHEPDALPRAPKRRGGALRYSRTRTRNQLRLEQVDIGERQQHEMNADMSPTRVR